MRMNPVNPTLTSDRALIIHFAFHMSGMYNIRMTVANLYKTASIKITSLKTIL